jgi:signal transduction histidine kinase
LISTASQWRRDVPVVGRVGLRGWLNVLSVGLALAAIAELADPELLLDGFWVTLAIGAFVFSLGVAILRIALGALFVIVYTVMSTEPGEGGALDFELLDLAEWPLLVVISIIVTVMAHRVTTTAKRYAALYRQASDRLVMAHEEERGRLARDLHDSVGQTLTAVLLTLDVADEELGNGSGSGSPARTAVRRAQVLAAMALEQARTVAIQLKPPRIHELGLGATIRDLTETAGVPVEIRFDHGILPPRLLEPDQEIGAYRVVQEAIGNAARHSHAAHIWIDAEVSEELVQIEVGDDGVGFDQAARSRGMGLAGMQERSDILLGRLDIRSRPALGTTVTLAIPRESRLGPSEAALAGTPEVAR